MEIPVIHEYSDELNVNECRICFETNCEEELISPCNCCGSYKYVHQTCLNKWRQENINNERYRKCEVCKRDFKILNDYKPETLIYTIDRTMFCKLPIYLFIIYFLGGVIWAMDLSDSYLSINIISLGYPDKDFKSTITDYNNMDFNGFAAFYYSGFGVFSFSMIYFLLHILMIFGNVNRKYRYYKIFFPFAIFYLLGSLNIYISYLSYIIFNNPSSFIITIFASSINNYTNIYRLINKHNKIIKDLNNEIKNQVILSLEDTERITVSNETITTLGEITIDNEHNIHIEDNEFFDDQYNSDDSDDSNDSNDSSDSSDSSDSDDSTDLFNVIPVFDD